MTKRKWDDVAFDQFKSMPKEFQNDWQELRKIVHKKW